MAATAKADFNDALQITFMPSKLISMALRDAPFTAYLPKKNDGHGELCTMRFHVSDSGGAAPTVSAARTQAKSGKWHKAAVDWKLGYVEGGINLADANRSKGGDELVDMFTHEQKSIAERAAGVLETFFIGIGNSKLGRRASASTNVITLTDKQDCFNFSINDTVVADDAIDGSSLRAGETYVVGIDYDNGTVTLNDASAITGFANNDYLFMKGFVNGGAPGGIGHLISHGAPAALGTLTRTGNPTALSGWKYTAQAGQTVLETILSALSYGGQFGGKQDAFWVSTMKLNELLLEMHNKVDWVEVKGDYDVSHQGIRIRGPKGPCVVMTSPKIPTNLGWATQRDTLKVVNVNQELLAPRFKNGQSYLDMVDADEVAIGYRFQTQLTCERPICNGAVTFNS